MDKLYKMPLQFDELIKQKPNIEACSLRESIEQNIFLIVSSRFQEHRFDDEYGCEVWSKDFELITNPLQWQENVNRSIINSLTAYERRLERIDVDTSISQVLHENPRTKMKMLKKRLAIRVRGYLRSTGQAFEYTPHLFLSPISLD
jgi:phage baseplate assembly protein W